MFKPVRTGCLIHSHTACSGDRLYTPHLLDFNQTQTSRTGCLILNQFILTRHCSGDRLYTPICSLSIKRKRAKRRQRGTSQAALLASADRSATASAKRRPRWPRQPRPRPRPRRSPSLLRQLPSAGRLRWMRHTRWQRCSATWTRFRSATRRCCAAPPCCTSLCCLATLSGARSRFARCSRCASFSLPRAREREATPHLLLLIAGQPRPQLGVRCGEGTAQ